MERSGTALIVLVPPGGPKRILSTVSGRILQAHIDSAKVPLNSSQRDRIEPPVEMMLGYYLITYLYANSRIYIYIYSEPTSNTLEHL